MEAVHVNRGELPLILSFPHGGTHIPNHIFKRLNSNGQILADTDWHINRLYENLVADVTTVHATFHRYVIDANRDPSGVSLYPGQNTTGLIPLTDFDGNDIWTIPPDDEFIQAQLTEFHCPYHAALAAEIARLKSKHGYVILYDCHSIRSSIPFLFKGQLPDFNIGTNDSASANIAIEATIDSILTQAAGYSHVFNGRFKGGWTTRHYGDPSNHVYAVQMELAQQCYLTTEAAPFSYDNYKANCVRMYLREILLSLVKVKLN